MSSRGDARPWHDGSEMKLVAGILSVVQTPFDEAGQVDYESLERLVAYATGAGVQGLVAPAVASEVAFLTGEERERIVRMLAGRTCFVAGASADAAEVAAGFVRQAEEAGADAALVAVPEKLYGDGAAIVSYFKKVSEGCALPLLVQDLQWNGPGMELETIERLRDSLPSLAGLKIETAPAGPKYTQVKERLGRDFFVAGGWAVPQMLEALDRGVDAMIPESSMVAVYEAIWREYRAGRRNEAMTIFWGLLPVLSFTNQEIRLSIAFFKRLLERRGVIAHAGMRWPGFTRDRHSARIADELIEWYLNLEDNCGGDSI